MPSQRYLYDSDGELLLISPSDQPLDIYKSRMIDDAIVIEAINVQLCCGIDDVPQLKNGSGRDYHFYTCIAITMILPEQIVYCTDDINEPQQRILVPANDRRGRR